jgi:LmbE family N-acetylglucosaminyl deacetylase
MNARLSFVAHPDDDLLFMNPDIASDIQAGLPSWTAYLTAGNIQPAPAGYPYADERIKGLRAAYARTAGVANDWDWIPITLTGRQVVTNQLKAAPHVNLVFTYIDAAAGPEDNFGDLHRMWHDPQFVAQLLDNRPSYTRATLVAMLKALIEHVNPLFLRITDPYGQQVGDHVDHAYAGKFAATANLDANGKCVRRMDSYFGYLAKAATPNFSGYWSDEKWAAFDAYRAYDPEIAPGAHSEMRTRQHRRHVWAPGDTWLDL